MLELYCLPHSDQVGEKNNINGIKAPLDIWDVSQVCHLTVKQGAIHRAEDALMETFKMFLARHYCKHCKSKPMITHLMLPNNPPLFFVSSCANLCYLVHWPAVCQLNMALNKMSLRTWGTSVFWWMRTQQHNLLPAIPVSISPFQIQDRGGAVCVCVGENVSETEGCVCVWGGLLLLLLPLLCYHIMLCYWPLVFSQLDTVPSNLR